MSGLQIEGLERKRVAVPASDGSTINVRVHQGGTGRDVLFLHGAGGLLPNDPFLQALGQTYRVSAPCIPGYDDTQGGEYFRTMLDYSLHALDVLDALALENPIVVGHSMGGMLAAEMAAIARTEVTRLVLVSPAGLWLDEHPIADLFATLPYELPALLFHNPDAFGNLLSAGGDFNDPEYLTDFMVGNSRRLGSAGKLLFPIPDRGLADRLYRLRAETQIVWGANDALIPAAYAHEFQRRLPHAQLTMVEQCGHMVPYEQPEAVLGAIARASVG